MTNPAQRTGIYCRMSLVAMNDPTKVEDQARISRDLAASLGWPVAAGCGHPGQDGVYTDNSRSAWKKNRKRPAWDAMLADIEAGLLDAIIVYHGDRLMRQPRDLEDLVDLAEGKGIRLAAPTGTRNLDNPDDRFVLRILTAQACMESDNTSRRRKAQYDRWRREGRVRPGGRGGRAYGFATDGITHIPAECGHIRDMAAMILAGSSAGGVVRDAAARGALTPAGRPFSYSTVRKMLARPRYAGLMPDGESKAAWEPVLDRETWERVRLALDAKAAGFPAATNARKWMLSGIAVCGGPGCGRPLQVNPSQGRGGKAYVTGYACRDGCRRVYRSALLLDAYVSARVVHLLNDPRQPRPRVPADPAGEAEWAALTREQAETQALLADYSASAGRARVLMARLDSIEARMGQLREREAGDARSRLLGRYRGITMEQFGGLPLDVRRALVAASYRVVVLPASGRGPGFRTEDVRLEPHG